MRGIGELCTVACEWRGKGGTGCMGQGQRCTNSVRVSLFETKVVADCHEQLAHHGVQEAELAFV